MSNKKFEDVIDKIEKVQEETLKDTDVLVLTINRHVTEDLARQLKQYLKKVFPNNKVAIIAKGAELTIYRGGDNGTE
jgi:glycerol-3-phosphate dehydrogenase